MSKSFRVPVTVASTGAAAAVRWVGGTATAAPTTGTWVAGDHVFTQDGHIFICTVGGTPGTWVDAGAYGAGSSAVTQIIAGTNVTVSPAGGTGAVTVSAGGGGGAPTVSSITTTTTAVTNTIYLANGTFTVTIPVAVNTQVTVKNTGTGTVTVVMASGQLEGAASAVLAQNASINVVADGTNGWIV